MKTLSDLSADRVRELLEYDPSNGEFTWKKRVNFGIGAGDRAGSTTAKGYHEIRIGRKGYCAHRIAWLYVNGTWPDGHIDHIDGNPLNNRIDNLRIASHATNMQNRLGKSMGARKSGSKYQASIKVDGKTIHLGMFDTKKQAQEAYLCAKRKLHADFVMPAPPIAEGDQDDHT